MVMFTVFKKAMDKVSDNQSASSKEEDIWDKFKTLEYPGANQNEDDLGLNAEVILEGGFDERGPDENGFSTGVGSFRGYMNLEKSSAPGYGEENITNLKALLTQDSTPKNSESLNSESSSDNSKVAEESDIISSVLDDVSVRSGSIYLNRDSGIDSDPEPEVECCGNPFYMMYLAIRDALKPSRLEL